MVGATGFVGSRLIPELLARGHRVRALVRDPRRLSVSGIESHVVDIDSGAGLDTALRGCDAAVWLVHRMAEGEGFADRDNAAARRFAEAASRNRLERVVYLGGLVPPGVELSEHLRSRAEVGSALREAGISVTELRAGVILGAGSASFEILRQLTEHLPVMITPKWVLNRTQPIAIGDLVTYLADVCEDARALGRTFDVGGPEVLTFLDMMRRFAVHRGLPQVVIPVPVLTPRLSSRWIGLVTDVDPVLARPLVESLRHETICTEGGIRELNDRELLGFEAAVDAALLDAKARGMTTRLGCDARYAAHVAAGMALNWACIGVTDSERDEGIEIAFAVLTAMGLYAAETLGAEDSGLTSLSRENVASIGVGALAGLASAGVSGLFVEVAGSNPRVRAAARRALARDRKGRPISAAALACMGVVEELYWRGTLQHSSWSKGRAAVSALAWMATVLASRDPMLSLSAVTLGPFWAALSEQRGPLAAAAAHAVWLPATRWVARRRFLQPPGRIRANNGGA